MKKILSGIISKSMKRTNVEDFFRISLFVESTMFKTLLSSPTASDIMTNTFCYFSKSSYLQIFLALNNYLQEISKLWATGDNFWCPSVNFVALNDALQLLA